MQVEATGSAGINVVCGHCQAVNRVPPARLQESPRCGRCHAPLFGEGPIALDDAALRRQIERSALPLVVDFWAEWCGPCKAMAPVFAEAARRMEPRLRFAKLDTEAHPSAAARHAIRSIPTLILFSGGREIARHSGALSLPQLSQWLAREAA